VLLLDEQEFIDKVLKKLGKDSSLEHEAYGFLNSEA
jgi:hypothetical protein